MMAMVSPGLMSRLMSCRTSVPLRFKGYVVKLHGALHATFPSSAASWRVTMVERA